MLHIHSRGDNVSEIILYEYCPQPIMFKLQGRFDYHEEEPSHKPPLPMHIERQILSVRYYPYPKTQSRNATVTP